MLCEWLAQQLPGFIQKHYGHMDFSRIQEITGLTKKEILETRCGLTREAIEQLLNFRHRRRILVNSLQELSPDYAYFFDFEGITTDGYDTGTDHEFIVINVRGVWWIFDSYLGCRRFTCRSIHPNELLNASRHLQKHFDEKIWQNLTQCPSTDHPNELTDRMHVYIYRSEFS